MKRAGLMAAVVGCGLLMLAGRDGAAPLAERVPADAVVYVGWVGADQLAAKYANSNLKGLIDQTTVGSYVMENWEGWLEKATANAQGVDGAVLGQEIGEVARGLKLAVRHPMAFYVGPVGLAGNKAPTFRTAILCDAGADAPALSDAIKGELAKHPAPAEVHLKVTVDGTLVIVTFGDADPAAFMDGARPNTKVLHLSNVPAYTSAMEHLPKDSAVAMYVDIAAIVKAVQDGVAGATDAPAEAKKAIPAVIQALGVTSLTQLAYEGDFDGKGWTEQAFVGAPGPRTGLVGLMDAGPVTDGALAMVPKDAVSMSVGRMDMAKLLGVVREVIGKADAGAGKQFEMGLKMADAQVKFDIEKDLIDALGDEWVVYRAAEGGQGAFAMVQKLRDGPAFEKALAAITELVNHPPAEGPLAPLQQEISFEIEKTKAGSIEVSAVRTPRFTIAWCVRNGILYVAPLNGIEAAVAQVEGKGPSILENADYQAVRASLPKEKASAVQYAVPAELYPQVYQGLAALQMVAMLAGVNLPGDLLPTPAKAAPFMTPGGGISWSDGEGFHFESRSAFPGAEMLSGQMSPAAGVAVVALGTAVVLPSVVHARGQAMEIQDMSNMRQIGQMCLLYAAEHDNDLPDQLARLQIDIKEGLGDGNGGASINLGKLLASPRSKTVPLAMTPELEAKEKSDFAGFAKEVEAHSDYVYLGYGLKVTDTNLQTTILMYEKPGAYTVEGIPGLFYDGHVELLTWKDLPQAFKATNAFLKEHGKPEVDVEGLLKQGPGAGG